MTRVVGGKWGGRRLVTPAGDITRPTSEKVRAALASSLTATGGLDGARVLDLYAGSGALGLELLSRGAWSAVFVERDRSALTALRANVTALAAGESGLGDRLSIVPGDVDSYVGSYVARAHGTPGDQAFDVVVADPPYDLPVDELMMQVLALHKAGLLAPQADLVLERRVKSGAPLWPDPIQGVRAKRYGDTLLCYGRAP